MLKINSNFSEQDKQLLKDLFGSKTIDTTIELNDKINELNDQNNKMYFELRHNLGDHSDSLKEAKGLRIAAVWVCEEPAFSGRQVPREQLPSDRLKEKQSAYVQKRWQDAEWHKPETDKHNYEIKRKPYSHKIYR